ncbi:anchored repeat ABC transporter, substrate-binding protein [Actinotalea sp. BY-33]|uniref:Anchored repeat ABC transporter, substrate-binding protein n=1 Tax=Actinotalea soli TaxID=2819234 RepID=A0A939LTG9_9CELL|nr:anchored repeat ABC transporter, substrate-binding protein [Actinotalea soli]MBO1751037.1 anchored repeat ABC transporter, substrate-binding protein [Actinotalea soli]
MRSDRTIPAAARATRAAAAGALVATLVGCGTTGTGPAGGPDAPLSVVTTTEVLADLARNVAGDRAQVTSLVPRGGDPASHEPSLRDVRDVVYADVAFSGYALLEGPALTSTLEANLRAEADHVVLAEAAVKYAATIIPLVENVNLDTLWLGLAVTGTGERHGATRASDVELRAVGLDGPGQLTGYVTETFGQPRVFLDSADGFDDHDAVTLPTDAHTHMSWTFSEPGVYALDVEAELHPAPEADPVWLGRTTVTFAVGVEPHEVAAATGATVLDDGHADLAVELDQGAIVLAADATDDHGSHDGEDASGDHGGDHDGHHHHYSDPEQTLIAVPTKALAPVPAGPDFAFLGRAGDQIYQLPQAVLGKHVHGEIDPHLWQDVRNAQAYVEIIRDTLVEADPEGAEEYRANAAAYLRVLEETDADVQRTIAAVPVERRYLVTTHDAFAYLGAAYDVEIAGFVTPSAATEPSVAERARLTRTVRTLGVPAVFLEQHLAARSAVLTEVARENGIEVCPIYSQSFDREVTTYVQMVRANADSIHRCLS